MKTQATNFATKPDPEWVLFVKVLAIAFEGVSLLENTKLS